jgi:hypothetical protein
VVAAVGAAHVAGLAASATTNAGNINSGAQAGARRAVFVAGLITGHFARALSSAGQ